jgi:nitronate monooxygenase
MMLEPFALAELTVRVIVAPMAGGPSTPKLAAAATNAGGLGFIAGGLLPAVALAERLVAARRLTPGPLGVNLFVPQPPNRRSVQFDAYATALAGEADRYGVRLGEPRYDDDDWAAKLDVVHDLRPEMVSFTFGLPTMTEISRLKSVGITPAATVTTLDEAVAAVARGADVLVAQGPCAGGHRATFDAVAVPADASLNQLLAELAARVDTPVVAAGGLATSEDVHGVIGSGAIAAQCGTAFLLADEAGTNPVHRAALTDPQFTETVLTRVFTGRYARGLRNRFIEEHEDEALFGFPEVGMLTGPVQAASVRVGDPHGTSLWAGAAFRKAKAGSAADIMGALW